MSFLGGRGQHRQPTAETKFLLVVPEAWKINFSFSKTEFKGFGFGFLGSPFFFFYLVDVQGASVLSENCSWLLVWQGWQSAGGMAWVASWPRLGKAVGEEAEAPGQWATGCINFREQPCWSLLLWQQWAVPAAPKSELNERKLLVSSKEKRN